MARALRQLRQCSTTVTASAGALPTQSKRAPTYPRHQQQELVRRPVLHHSEMLLLLCLGCAGEVQPELLPRMCVPWLYGLRLADYPGCCDAWLAAAGRCDHLMTLDLTNCNMVRGWARGVWEGGEGEGQGVWNGGGMGQGVGGGRGKGGGLTAWWSKPATRRRHCSQLLSPPSAICPFCQGSTHTPHWAPNHTLCDPPCTPPPPRTLHILATQITDAGLAHVGQLLQLRQLLLVNCCQITDVGLAHISGERAAEGGEGGRQLPWCMHSVWGGEGGGGHIGVYCTKGEGGLR
jgi:hypothetical protein